MDDLELLRELARGVYVTREQRAALQRAIEKMSRAPHRQPPIAKTKVTDGATEALTVPPLLGPGEEL